MPDAQDFDLLCYALAFSCTTFYSCREAFTQVSESIDDIAQGQYLVQLIESLETTKDSDAKIAILEETKQTEASLTNWPMPTPRDLFRASILRRLGYQYQYRLAGIRQRQY